MEELRKLLLEALMEDEEDNSEEIENLMNMTDEELLALVSMVEADIIEDMEEEEEEEEEKEEKEEKKTELEVGEHKCNGDCKCGGDCKCKKEEKEKEKTPKQKKEILELEEEVKRIERQNAEFEIPKEAKESNEYIEAMKETYAVIGSYREFLKAGVDYQTAISLANNIMTGIANRKMESQQRMALEEAQY